MKVKITSDSTCDLSPELLEKYGIDLLPIAVVLGDREGRDGVDVFPDDIYSYVAETGKLPKTCATNIAEYSDYFKSYTDRGYSVVHFCLGRGLSSTYNNARLAAEENDAVRVVDSANLSTGHGLLLLKGAEMAQRGCSADEIWKECTETAPRVEASFVIDSLDYLYKGGRCSALAALGANLLKIKPCIEVRDSVCVPGEKYRGKMDRVTMQYVEDRLTGRTDIDTSRIFVTHTRCPEELVNAVVARVRELVPDAGEILETTAGSTVTVHCGPNTLGVLFIRKP